MHQILIAEEDSALRQAMCAELRKNMGSRCAVLEAADGREAQAHLAQRKPRLAILSVELPDLGGLEVARQIRRSGSPCMLLFLSAHENFAQAREAISLRALNYLPKPCGEGELLRAVEEGLSLLEQCPEAADTRMLCGQLAAYREAPGNLRLDQFRAFIEQYVRENYQLEFSMQDVARAMNYSDAYFCKLFKQCFQITFSAYLNNYRIVQARELLQNTRMNVREIGLSCGYTDANYFARIFKRLTGMTPTEYRFWQQV